MQKFFLKKRNRMYVFQRVGDSNFSTFLGGIYLDRIEDVMTTDVETVSLHDTLYNVAVKMNDLNVGAMPVVDGKKLVGIVTDRDIVIRGIAENLTGSDPVQKVMTSDVITVKPDQSIRHAIHLMSEHQIRRLPVVNGDELVGIVALGDLAVNEKSDSQAKKALSEISEPTRGQNFLQ